MVVYYIVICMLCSSKSPLGKFVLILAWYIPEVSISLSWKLVSPETSTEIPLLCGTLVEIQSFLQDVYGLGV